jgi:hypothetical protein
MAATTRVIMTDECYSVTFHNAFHLAEFTILISSIVGVFRPTRCNTRSDDEICHNALQRATLVVFWIRNFSDKATAHIWARWQLFFLYVTVCREFPTRHLHLQICRPVRNRFFHLIRYRRRSHAAMEIPGSATLFFFGRVPMKGRNLQLRL